MKIIQQIILRNNLINLNVIIDKLICKVRFGEIREIRETLSIIASKLKIFRKKTNDNPPSQLVSNWSLKGSLMKKQSWCQEEGE